MSAFSMGNCNRNYKKKKRKASKFVKTSQKPSNKLTKSPVPRKSRILEVVDSAIKNLARTTKTNKHPSTTKKDANALTVGRTRSTISLASFRKSNNTILSGSTTLEELPKRSTTSIAEMVQCNTSKQLDVMQTELSKLLSNTFNQIQKSKTSVQSVAMKSKSKCNQPVDLFSQERLQQFSLSPQQIKSNVKLSFDHELAKTIGNKYEPLQKIDQKQMRKSCTKTKKSKKK